MGITIKVRPESDVVVDARQNVLNCKHGVMMQTIKPNLRHFCVWDGGAFMKEVSLIKCSKCLVWDGKRTEAQCALSEFLAVCAPDGAAVEI